MPSCPSLDARRAAMRRATSWPSSASTARFSQRKISSFAAAWAPGAPRSRSLDQVFALLRQSNGRNDLVDKTDLHRAPGAEHLRRQKVATRLARADRIDDIRTDRRRGQAELDLAQAEGRPVRRDHRIAARDQPDAAAIGGSLHHADRRLVQPVQRVQHVRERLRVGGVGVLSERRYAAHPVEIGAGTEAAADARQHDDADVRMVIELAQGARHLADERVVEGVVPVRPVQGQARDAALVDLHQKRTHDGLLTSGKRRTASPGWARSGSPTARARGRGACPPDRSRRHPKAARWRNRGAPASRTGRAPAA